MKDSTMRDLYAIVKDSRMQEKRIAVACKDLPFMLAVMSLIVSVVSERFVREK